MISSRYYLPTIHAYYNVSVLRSSVLICRHSQRQRYNFCFRRFDETNRRITTILGHRPCRNDHEVLKNIIRNLNIHTRFEDDGISDSGRSVMASHSEFPFREKSQLPPSSSSILKQNDFELSKNELKLKVALNEYINKFKARTPCVDNGDADHEDSDDGGGEDDDTKQYYMYLLDEVQKAFIDLEFWKEALTIEQFKCRTNFESETDEYADSIHIQGKYYLRQNDFINSKRLYEIAFKYFEGTNNTTQQGHVLISLAGWYFFQNNNNNDSGDNKLLHKALDCLKQSESVLGSNPSLLVKCLDNQGLIHRLLEEFRLALDNYQQALQVAVDKETRSAIQMHVADMHLALEESDEALLMYQDLLMERTSIDSLEQQKSYDNISIRGVLLHNIASIHVVHGDYGLALEEFQEALQMKRIAGGEHNPEVAKTLNSLGALYGGVFDDKIRAMEYFKQALLIARIHANDDECDDIDIKSALQNISRLEHDLHT